MGSFRDRDSELTWQNMNIQSLSQRLGLWLLIIVVAGCSSPAQTEPTPSPFSPAPPAATTASTVTPASTNIPTPPPTLPPVPALPLEAARKRLLDLLITNGDCRLPCVWGIMPGGSTYQQAQSILQPLSGISNAFELGASFDGTGGYVFPSYAQGDEYLKTEVDYLSAGSGTISRIHFQVLQEQVTTDENGNWLTKRPIFNDPDFAKRAEYYSLRRVLAEQGMPASVMIEASGRSADPVVAGGIDIALLYPERGIWANYTMPMYNLGQVKTGCPAVAHVEMELFPPGNPDSFFAQLERTDWGVTKDGYEPLEEVTTMSVEQFYEAFRSSVEECLETPANIWPTPDR